ncbi:uncharacterized protein LOC128610653 [Ictalurus furcatus]|uniref:uncharacterized protein LOC128610653 n=1 Tax=Ictalurus furcatus TaxID=66913 RepID=UPI002350222D|nr:uncharacterized protein LOC128610653 [Ictalurus furcatus]
MYNWNKDGVQISSYTESRKYSFTPVESLSAKYTCSGRRRSDSQTSETSNTVTLTVSVLPKPVVSINPDEQVYRGETVTLRCDIQDEEDSDWIYSWNKDGSGVSSEQEYRISSAETSHAEKPKPELTPSREGAVLKGNAVTLSCTLKLQSAGWKFYWIKPTQSTETETETDYYNISSVRVSDGEIPISVVTIKPDKHVFKGETVFYHLCLFLSSVSGSTYNTVIVFVSVGLSLAFLFIILLLILHWWHKSNTGKDRDIQQNSNQTPGQNPSQSGAEDSQSRHTPLQTDVHIYATVENASKSDAAAELSGAVYAQVMKKKEPHNNKNDVAGPSDVTYTELELKPQKKTKKNQVKVSVEYGTVYSQLKQST